MSTTIIGIDCAVQDKNVGLALASFDEDKLEARIKDVRVGNREGSVLNIVADWIKQDPTALLALDAPLGWPIGLRKALRNHKAGKPVRVKPDDMFRRGTDRLVKRVLGKTPLDVGADRIARTAHAALRLLHKLRARTGEEIRLAWKPGPISRTWAIEVYPAGTVAAYEKIFPAYKGKYGGDRRQLRLGVLKEHVKLPIDRTSRERLENNDHALDAAICVLAGVDFLQREVYEPPDLKLAKKEGWIWVKKREGAQASE